MKSIKKIEKRIEELEQELNRISRLPNSRKRTDIEYVVNVINEKRALEDKLTLMIGVENVL